MTEKLRFKDYNGLYYPEWQINIFSELYMKASEGGTPSTKDIKNYNPKEYSFVKIDDLNNKYLKETQNYISDIGLRKSSAWIVPANSILYSNGATIGACSINKIDCTTKQGILGIIPNEKILTEFLYYTMVTNMFTKEVKKNTTKGTMESVYLKDLNNIKIKIPCLQEQQKIADFLSTVDKKIENQKEIVKNLEKIKKGLLQKIFSQEIRFKSNNGLDYPEWEEKKLIDLCMFLKGNKLSKSDVSIDGDSCILYGELYTKYKESVRNIYSRTKSKIKNPIVGKINDLLIPSSGESALEIATASCLLVDNVIIGGDINILRPIESNGVFLSYQINHVKNSEIASLAQGNSVVHLYNNQFKNISILVPSNEEQQRIAEFFLTIDEKIEKEKNILKSWIEIKKGLIHRIFL